MNLNPQQIRHLRGLAHHLKPVVMIGGKGLSAAVIAELNRALEDHELIKVSIAGAEREERRALSEAMREACGAELVQIIGRVSVLYRRAQKPVLELPK